MSSHFRYYSEAPETVPFSASYPPPSQAIKSFQSTVKIPPKNANTFNPGDKIRIELPPQGYWNARESYLELDVTLSGYDATTCKSVRFQQGIQSIFERKNWLYGGLPLEDTMHSDGIDRLLLEAGCGRDWSESTGTITEGVAISCLEHEQGMQLVTDPPSTSLVVSGEQILQDLAGAMYNSSGSQVRSSSSTTRRYTILLNTGVSMTAKNWPLQWLASQMALELYLAPASKCMYVVPQSGQTPVVTYQVTNVNFVLNLLTFSDLYDQAFQTALNSPSGVPIKFNAFTYHTLNLTGSSNTLQIQTRHRSIKSVFAVIRDQSYSYTTDSGIFFFDAAIQSDGSGTPSSTVLQYQWRIGGRYYPSQPV